MRKISFIILIAASGFGCAPTPPVPEKAKGDSYERSMAAHEACRTGSGSYVNDTCDTMTPLNGVSYADWRTSSSRTSSASTNPPLWDGKAQSKSGHASLAADPDIKTYLAALTPEQRLELAAQWEKAAVE